MRTSVCHVYLEDVRIEDQVLSSSSSDSSTLFQDWRIVFANSRWFKRGWTLQELIAPRRVEFYDRDKIFLGSRHDLAAAISEVCYIDEAALRDTRWRGRELLDTFSIAQRMAWAATRETTEPEDIAYCLVGTTGVRLALNYGEGPRTAFARLQMEIVRQTSDESVFAWTDGTEGLFVSSPLGYLDSWNIVSLPQSLRGSGHQNLTTGGLRISTILMDLRELGSNHKFTRGATHVIVLACPYGDTHSYVPGLLLKSAQRRALDGEPAFYAVGGPSRIVTINIRAITNRSEQIVYILTKPAPELEGSSLDCTGGAMIRWQSWRSNLLANGSRSRYRRRKWPSIGST